MWVLVHVWRPEEGISCPLHLSYFFEAWSLPELGTQVYLAKLESREPQGSFCSRAPSEVQSQARTGLNVTFYMSTGIQTLSLWLFSKALRAESPQGPWGKAVSDVDTLFSHQNPFFIMHHCHVCYDMLPGITSECSITASTQGNSHIKCCPTGTPNVACFSDLTLSDWGIIFCAFICICVFACGDVHLPVFVIRCSLPSLSTLFIESGSLGQTKSLPNCSSKHRTAPVSAFQMSGSRVQH